MPPEDIHIMHHQGAGWSVKQPYGTSTKCFGKFRIREHAEAFGRALAHRGKVALIVHQPDGRQARIPASALTYPVSLS